MYTCDWLCLSVCMYVRVLQISKAHLKHKAPCTYTNKYQHPMHTYHAIHNAYTQSLVHVSTYRHFCAHTLTNTTNTCRRNTYVHRHSQPCISSPAELFCTTQTPSASDFSVNPKSLEEKSAIKRGRTSHTWNSRQRTGMHGLSTVY